MVWKRLSVTWKLFVAIALTSAVVVAFMAVMIAVSMRSGFSQYLLEAELDRFPGLAPALAETYDPAAGGWPDLAGNIVAWRTFVREHKELEPEAQRPPPPGPPPRKDPLQMGSRFSLVDAVGATVVGPESNRGLVSKRPIEVAGSGGASETVGWVVLAAPTGGVVAYDVFLSGQFHTLILASLLAILASAFVAFLLARQFLAPVRALVRGTEVLAAGDYKTRMDNRRLDEFGELIDHFNALADSLEKAEKAERQWISDASHELQTPLAVLRAEIEALQDGVRLPDEKTLADLKAQILRLSLLVGDINALSHAREGHLLTTMADEDLSAIVTEAADAIRPRLHGTGLSLEAGIAPGIMLECDRGRIRQLVDNLLENARRYTAAPGRISLSLARQGGEVVLLIEDTAPAPPEDAMEKLFDRFYRVDTSRARQLGGSGLGLAICREIVRAHGGSIAAARSELGGLAIRVALPVEAKR